MGAAAHSSFHYGTGPGFHGSTNSLLNFDVPGALATDFLGSNNRGAAVGDFGDEETVHAFLWNRGTVTVVDPPGAYGALARAINDSGIIGGSYTSSTTHAFVAFPMK